MKTATYSKKFNMLTLWVNRNVTETKNCYSKKQAIEIVKNSKIEQILI